MDKLNKELNKQLLLVLDFNEIVIIDSITAIELPSEAEYLLQLTIELVFIDKLKTYITNNVKYKTWRHRLSKRQKDMLEYLLGQTIMHNDDNGKQERFFANHGINAYY